MRRIEDFFRFAAILVLTAVPGCIPGNGSPVTGPEDPGDLTVTVSGGAGATAGSLLELQGSASGGTVPYAFRWDQNAGPQSLLLENATSSTLRVEGITQAGRFVFRVVVTDAAGRTARAFAAVDVAAGLTLSVSPQAQEVFEGSAATIVADVVAANQPLTFAWSLLEGPMELDLGGVLEGTLTTEPLTATGEYTFQVTVTDAAGLEATASAEVKVLQAVNVSVPALVVVGEAVALTATFEAELSDVELLWESTGAAAVIEEPSSTEPQMTGLAIGTIDLRLSVTLGATTDSPVTTVREFEVVSVENLTPRARIETNFGELVFELDAERAPGHTTNFLLYVDDGFYDGLVFHRAACLSSASLDACEPFVLQGGGFARVDGELTLQEPTRDPIESESGNGLTNGERFSVSMALTGGDVDSAETQFFINLADNAFLDDQGFTVFGRVVEGMDVIEAIFAVAREENPLGPSGEVSLPSEDVIMQRVVRDGS